MPRQHLTYHLLESLANCKSCVIVALLANEGVPGGLEQLVEMFEVLLTGIRPEHNEVLTRIAAAATNATARTRTKIMQQHNCN